MSFITTTDHGSRLRVVTVAAASIPDAAALETSLKDGVADLNRTIVEATESAGLRVVVDLRAGTDMVPGAAELLAEAVRGMIQAYTLESASTIQPVNLVLTTADQAADRMTTWDFLDDKDGGMARGATFDLRETP